MPQLTQQLIMDAETGNTYEIVPAHCVAYLSGSREWSQVRLSVLADAEAAQAYFEYQHNAEGKRIEGEHMAPASVHILPPTAVAGLLEKTGGRVAHVTSPNPATRMDLPHGRWHNGMIAQHHGRFIATWTPDEIRQIHEGAFLKQDEANPQTIQGYEWELKNAKN